MTMKTEDIDAPTFTINDQVIKGDAEVGLALCQTLNLPIYPEALRAEIDQIADSYPNYPPALLEKFLTFRTYIVGHQFTFADILVYSTLSQIPQNMARLNRYHAFISNDPTVKRYVNSQKPKVAATKAAAQVQRVCTRFAPEPSGFLHIGHAKAALASEGFARANKGKFILRFDDTNPQNESVEFEDLIKEDIKLLDIKYDETEHTSDYIPKVLEILVDMLKTDLAYIDTATNEEISEQRINLLPSPARDNSAEKNLQLWKEMQDSTELGLKCVVRAKIDYKSNNGCLRDPVIARRITKPHHILGDAVKIFPTYDLACPIVDSLAGVTHAMRSWEYTDRDQQYQWFIEKLKLNKVKIVSFSRLSFYNTALGKRHLRKLVQNGLAENWDDPRFPTVRGLRRRGLQPSAIRAFCEQQGASRNQNLHQWDKLWAMNRDIIVPSCPRVMSVNAEQMVEMEIEGAQESVLKVAANQRFADKGERELSTGNRVCVEKDDISQLKVGEKVSLMHWCNVIIDEITEEKVKAHYTEDRNFKDTRKINWIVKDKAVKVIMREWNHLLKDSVLGEGVDIVDALAQPSYLDTEVLCDESIGRMEKGAIAQLERRAEIIIDSVEGTPVVFLIPTGMVRPVGLPVKMKLTIE